HGCNQARRRDHDAPRRVGASQSGLPRRSDPRRRRPAAGCRIAAASGADIDGDERRQHPPSALRRCGACRRALPAEMLLMTRAFVAGLLLFAFCRTFAAEGAALVIAGATVIHPEREAASAVESDQTL